MGNRLTLDSLALTRCTLRSPRKGRKRLDREPLLDDWIFLGYYLQRQGVLTIMVKRLKVCILSVIGNWYMEGLM